MNVYNIQNTPADVQPYNPSVPTAIVVDAEPVYGVPAPAPITYPQGPSSDPNQFVQAPAPVPVPIQPNYLPSATPAPTELDSEAKCYKKHRVGIVMCCILDIFFGYGIIGIAYILLIVGFVYTCTFNTACLGVYVFHRYFSTAYLLYHLFINNLTAYGFFALAINIVLTIYVTYVAKLAASVGKKYTAEQINHYNFRVC